MPRTHERHLQSFETLLREVEDYCYLQGIYDAALQIRHAFQVSHAPPEVVAAISAFLNDFLNSHPAIAQRLVDNADWGKGRP